MISGRLTFLLFFITLSALHSQTKFEPYWGINNCPENNDVRVLSIDSNDVLYAAVWGDGIYRSTDDAVSWQRMSEGLTNSYVTCIEIDSAGTVYAGTYGDGIFKSTDQGAAWTQVSTEYLNDLNVKAIAFYPNGDLLAGTFGGGIARMDTSNKWRILNYRLDFLDVNCIVLTEQNYIVIGTNGGGIFRSSDNGVSWFKVNEGLRSYTIMDLCIARNGEIYAATLGGGVHISKQDGTGWEVYFDKDNHPMNANCLVEYAYKEPIVGTNDRGVVKCDMEYAGIPPDNNPWRNTDRTYYGVNDIVVNSKGYVFTAQPYNGILRSTDGGYEYDWEVVQHFRLIGIENETGITPLLADDDGLMLCSGYHGGIYRSTDKGQTWELVALEDIQIYNYTKDNHGNLYAATDAGAFKSTDKGVTWTSLGWTRPIYSIAVNDEGDIFIADSLLRKSSDGGKTWDQKGNGIEDFELRFIEIGPNGYLYCNQYTNTPDAPTGLGRSTDNGETWEVILSNDETIAVEMAIKSDSILIATTNGLYISANYGHSWSVVQFGMSQIPFVQEVIVSDVGDIILFEVISKFIMKSTDDGVTWDTLWGGLIKGKIEDLAINNEGDMFATTTVLYRAIANKDLIVPEIVYPKDGIGGQPQHPTLDWGSVHNADLYEVQISLDPEFGDEFINEYAIISATYWELMYPLEYNTNYFWRVRSKRNISVSGWSDLATFTTATAPPNLIYPEANQFGLDTVFNSSWYRSEDAYGYHIQISGSEYFDEIIEQKENISDSTYYIDSLELDKNYYWRVRTLSGKGTSDWSEQRKFTTKMPGPELIKPLDKAFVPYNIVSFAWKKIDNADVYDIQVSRDSIFQDVVYEGPTDNDSTHKLMTLTYGISYYWRIKGRTDSNYSYWSEYRMFTTDLEAATLVSPADYSANLEIPIEFQWDASKDATSFQFQLARDAEFEDIIYEANDLEDKSLLYEEPLEFGTYYWRVRFFAEDLPGLWAEPWSFTINPGYVLLLKPENNANDVSDDDIFEWDAPELAEAFHIQVATDEEFDDVVFEKKELTSMKYSVSQAGLDIATKYYWRMRLIADNIPGLWSEVYNFTTGLDSPTLIQPLNEAEKVNVSCEFSWQYVILAEYYNLQIARDKNFDNIVHDLNNITETKQIVTLDSGTTYYWHVKAKYSGGEGAWSYTRSLKTEGNPSGINDSPLTVKYILAKPNPLNDMTEIELYLDSYCKVNIEIVDANGHLIKELINEYHSPGPLNIIWKPGNIAHGIYYLKVRAGNDEFMKKLLYIK